LVERRRKGSRERNQIYNLTAEKLCNNGLKTFITGARQRQDGAREVLPK